MFGAPGKNEIDLPIPKPLPLSPFMRELPNPMTPPEEKITSDQSEHTFSAWMSRWDEAVLLDFLSLIRFDLGFFF